MPDWLAKYEKAKESKQWKAANAAELMTAL